MKRIDGASDPRIRAMGRRERLGGAELQENAMCGCNFANSLNVATADTTRQWAHLKERLTATCGPTRATTMIHILSTDQEPRS